MIRISGYKKLLLALLAGGVVYSCSEEPKHTEVIKERIFPEFPVTLDSVIKVKDGVIRGFELGAARKNVEAFEYKKPEESDQEYLLYSYPIDSTDDYSIAYTFVNDTLDGVEVNIRSNNMDLSTEVINSLKKYYREKYTSPMMDKGIYVFNCFDSRKINFHISLTDNSTETKGIINMLVYREDDK